MQKKRYVSVTCLLSKDFHHTNKAKSCHKYKARERQSENKTNQQREQEYKLIQLIAKNTCNSPKPTKQTKQTNKLTNEQSKKNRNNNNKIIQTVTLAATLAKETNVNAQTNYEHQVKPLLLQNPTKTARTPSSYTNNNNTNNDERQSRTSESEK